MSQFVSLSEIAETPRPQAKRVFIVAERLVIPANEPEYRKEDYRDFWMPDQVRYDIIVDFNQP
ncbi:hypothetical protein OAC89_04440, partial [Deltaproteobacteria bacterium]|nr:hypothetical protein [Deltaproteobacteria bacterium]